MISDKLKVTVSTHLLAAGIGAYIALNGTDMTLVQKADAATTATTVPATVPVASAEGKAP